MKREFLAATRAGRLSLGIVAVVAAMGGAAITAPVARADAFSRCVASKWPAARRAGVSRSFFDQATRGLTPDPKTLELVNKQAEFVKPIWEYLDTAVSDKRVSDGRAAYARYRSTLNQIAAKYRVDPEVIIAIWGMETSYGNFMGGHNAVRASATLACATDRRQSFWTQQFTGALKIAQEGHVPLSEMNSSWGAAMGHTQFIPTSWQAYAVDFDGDGKRDIWRSIPDAFASTANYLNKHGWNYQQTWGYEVVVPRNFDHKLADGKRERALREWQNYGIRRANGKDWPRPDDQAYLFYPAGANGPAFLMLHNFDVIKRYNNADAYALGVGHLADRIIGGGDFEQAWPRDERPLSRGEVQEMQSLLTRRGFSTGGIDGQVGPMTRKAIREYQTASGSVPDGFASSKLLNELKRR
ncbi:lytic murein transglycosylase [Acuticoccus mangrovi]|uniref:Lytic murein transglycosylase n=1 Tax=Acuticoccus mangrovi TaxID=2796142 RepID=A0A934MLU4_9HYPH|nr:lytic murein transglycosylase [Acuticoccus mangrovi]MBJ3776684.1 lytic murein transglycosylase [Acuticoccus mangrovi]